jgi:proteasome accessory factor C
LVALRTLAEAGGDGDAVASLIAKIEDAAGASAAASSQVTIQIEGSNGPGVPAALNAALADGKRVHLRYYVHGRDEATERDVDPIKLMVVEGRTYLRGWCRLAEGVRTFRLDRMLDVEVLDAPAEVPQEAESVDEDEPLFRPSETDVLVELELGSGGRWAVESFQFESKIELPDGGLRVVLRTKDTSWIRRRALRLGEELRVIAPPELAEEVRKAAAAALALYD